MNVVAMSPIVAFITHVWENGQSHIILTYFDDFLIVYNTSRRMEKSGAVAKLRKTILPFSGELNFAVDSHENGVIRVSDLNLVCSTLHAYLPYEPLSQRALLHFSAPYSTSVKNGIASYLVAASKTALSQAGCSLYKSRVCS